MIEWLRRGLVVVVFALLALALVWLAASFALGARIELALGERYDQRIQAQAVDLLELEHHAGVFVSTGHAELRIGGGCSARIARYAPRVAVDYRIEHSPSVESLLRITWRARPLTLFGSDVRELLGNEPLIVGRAVVDYRGAIDARLQVSPRERQTRAGTFAIASAQARLHSARDDVQFSVQLPSLRIETASGRTRLSELVLQAKLHPGSRLEGRTWLSIASLEQGDTRAQNITVGTRSTTTSDQVNLDLAMYAGAWSAIQGVPLRDVGLKARVAGLDAASFDRVLQLAGERCGALALASGAATRWQAAIHELIRGGFAASLERLTARTHDGFAHGQLTLELPPREPTTLGPWLRNLQAVADLDVSSPALCEHIRSSRALHGFFGERTYGLGASAAFAQGSLQLNGHSWNPWLVDLTLGMLENALTEEH